MRHRVYSKRTIFVSQIFSALFFPFFTIFNFLRRKYNIDEIKIKTILVTEYHRIGDILIIEPILKSIKTKYPQAHLILVCSHNAKELALDLGLADEVIPIDVPWTNWSWAFLDWWRARTIAKELVNKEIDLAEPLGTETQLFFKIQNQEIISRMYNPRPVDVGEKINFQIADNKIHFFNYETKKAI